MQKQRMLLGVLAMVAVLLLVSASPVAAQSEDHRGPFGVGFDIYSNGVSWSVRAPSGSIADRMVMNIRDAAGNRASAVITLMGEGTGFSAFEGGRSFPAGTEVVVDFSVVWHGKVEDTDSFRTVVR